MTDKGFVYRHEKNGKKHLLTPEKCIRRQLELDTDILFCLDQCTHPDDSPETQRDSVERSLAWARRCRDEFTQRGSVNPVTGTAPTAPSCLPSCREATIPICGGVVPMNWLLWALTVSALAAGPSVMMAS